MVAGRPGRSRLSGFAALHHPIASLPAGVDGDNGSLALLQCEKIKERLGIVSEIAFHEKAGGGQVESFFFLLNKVFSSAE